ncbi:MAG TPA: nucleotide exchange factor GrpE, partial [Methanomicrobiales archaeon]|nr:nucleotide exchange factor GrpE [Methanomicrobiales archaeon]
MTGDEGGKECPSIEETDRLRKELAEALQLAGERLTRLQYLQADFENYRKGLDREKEQAVRFAGESLVRDLLPVLDDLDQALPSLSQEKNREGIQLLAR